MLYNIALVSAKHQHKSAIYTYVPSLLNFPSTCLPIPPLLVVTEPGVEEVWVPESHSKLTLAFCFTDGNNVSMFFCPYIPTLSFLPAPHVHKFKEILLHANCGIIHSSQILEATQISINWWRNKKYCIIIQWNII